MHRELSGPRMARAEVPVFVPPRCPHSDCPFHLAPKGRWFRRRGYYQPRCRSEPVPRFRCFGCDRSFSRQTFRHDCGDRKPHTNILLWRLLTSGVGLRQSGRLVDLDIHSVQGKLRKFARTCAFLHDNFCPALPPRRTYVFDEEETYERDRGWPVTIPVVIERDTWFVVSFAVAPIRRLAREGSRRRRRQDATEKKDKPRRDRSRVSVKWALRRLRQRTGKEPLALLSDEKPSYPTVIREIFRGRAVHERTPGTAPRTTFNPLFPINITMAMLRDNNGRLRRRTWLNTKVRECLVQQLQLFVIYRNYVRFRFNRDRGGECAAQFLKLLPRALQPDEVLRWRQDWGARSPHPYSVEGEFTVREKNVVVA